MSMVYIPGCTGKVAYPTRAEAKEHLKRLKQARYCVRPETLKVYLCPHSDGAHYHIGHRPGSRRNAME